MTETLHARLLNAAGELIAEGPCWLNDSSGEATLEPERAPGVLQKERGDLTLELESGRSFRVSDRPIIFRLRPPTKVPGHDAVRTMYRLRLLKDAQEANAAGAAGEGSPAAPISSGRLRLNGETPAAR
jgi:hypothetical protein